MTKSQGLRRRSGTRERHGMVGAPEYRTWVSMRQRCYDKNHDAYRKYGGRGITVCDRWNESFLAFYADMGPRPVGTTLDRVDNNGSYSPSNCRWTTRREQSRNTRRTIRMTIDGDQVSAIDIAEKNGIEHTKFHGRIRYGWTPEQAVGIEQRFDPRGITVNGETRTKAEWAAHIGISRQAVHIRLKHGWSIEEALTTPKGQGRSHA